MLTGAYHCADGITVATHAGPAASIADPASAVVVGFLPATTLWLADPSLATTVAGAAASIAAGISVGDESMPSSATAPAVDGGGGGGGGDGVVSFDDGVSGWFLKLISRPGQFFQWVPAPLRSQNAMLVAISVVAIVIGLLSSLVRYLRFKVFGERVGVDAGNVNAMLLFSCAVCWREVTVRAVGRLSVQCVSRQLCFITTTNTV